MPPKDKPEEIKRFPEWPALLYIDGYGAKIVSMKPGKNQQMMDTWDLILIPSDALIKRYNIQPEKLDEQGAYKIQLPIEFVIPLNLDPSWTRYLYLKTYDGKETNATSILNGTAQQKEIMRLKNELLRAKSIAEVEKEKSSMMESNLPKYLERTTKPILDNILPSIKTLIQKNE